MVQKEKAKAQRNKGVTAGKERNPNTYFSDTDSFEQSLGHTKSLQKVKTELQTVIDLMGPDTPHCNQSSSNDGDNEESVFSNVSITFLKKNSTEEENSKTFTENSTDKTIPPDITLQEETDLSMIVDKNSTVLESHGEYTQYICPPPLIPANVSFNSECMCPQIASYLHRGAMSMPCLGIQEAKKCEKHKNLLFSWFKNFRSKHREYQPGKRDYYTMNIKESKASHSPPRRLVFDLVGDVHSNEHYCQSGEFKEVVYPQTCDSRKSKELKNMNNEQLTKETQHEDMSVVVPKESVVNVDKNGRKFHQKTTYADSNGTTRVDVYYFDHGDSNYLKTTDSPPIVTTEALAEKTEAYTTKFWAEFFGTLHIGFAFCTSFVLQLFRFVLYSIVRPLTIGIVQLGSDYFFKPCIATTFNAIIQPPLIFLYNVATSLRDLCDPIAEGVGYFLREIANVIRAFRIVEIGRHKSDTVSKG